MIEVFVLNRKQVHCRRAAITEVEPHLMIGFLSGVAPAVTYNRNQSFAFNTVFTNGGGWEAVGAGATAGPATTTLCMLTKLTVCVFHAIEVLWCREGKLYPRTDSLVLRGPGSSCVSVPTTGRDDPIVGELAVVLV